MAALFIRPCRVNLEMMDLSAAVETLYTQMEGFAGA